MRDIQIHTRQYGAIRLACWTIKLTFGYRLVAVLLVHYETRLIYSAPRHPHDNWQPVDFAFEELYFVQAINSG